MFVVTIINDLFFQPIAKVFPDIESATKYLKMSYLNTVKKSMGLDDESTFLMRDLKHAVVTDWFQGVTKFYLIQAD